MTVLKSDGPNNNVVPCVETMKCTEFTHKDAFENTFGCPIHTALCHISTIVTTSIWVKQIYYQLFYFFLIKITFFLVNAKLLGYYKEHTSLMSLHSSWDHLFLKVPKYSHRTFFKISFQFTQKCLCSKKQVCKLKMISFEFKCKKVWYLSEKMVPSGM